MGWTWRLAQGGGGGLGEAEMEDLACFDQARHGADGVFDGSIGIDAMLVVEIDVIDVEALQAGIAGFADVVGLAVDGADAGVAGIADDAELGGEHDLVAPALDGASDEFFVGGAIHVGGIEEGDAEFEGAMDGGDGFVVVARP